MPDQIMPPHSGEGDAELLREQIAAAARPLRRIYYDDAQAAPRITRLSVAELMVENDGFEDEAELYVAAVLVRGVYDDSDHRSGVVCVYRTEDYDALRAQLEAWREQRPSEEQGR